MRVFLLVVSLVVLGVCFCAGQQYSRFSLNAGVVAATPEKQAVLSLWDAYLGSGFKNQPQFWDPAELQQYPAGDILLSEGYVKPNIYQYATEKIILSIERLDTAQYRCKTLFYWRVPTANAQQTTVFCIINTYFLHRQQRWFLRNSLTHYTQDWTTETVGNLTYRLPPTQTLNKQKAAVAQAFLAGLFQDFGIAPFAVTYYLAADCA